MDDRAPRPRTDFWTISLVALAVAARVMAIFLLESHTVPRSTYEHGEIATNLVNGRGFAIQFLGAEGSTSQQAPVYPALLALSYRAFGVESPSALLAMQLGQAACGGLLVLGVIRLCSIWLPGRPWGSRLAGLVVAVHPTQVYTATHIQVAGLVALLLVWLFVCAERSAVGRHRDQVLAGIVFAILILTDPILVLATPGVAWIVLRRARYVSGLGRLAVIAGVTTLGLAPWLVRNAVVHGEFVFVKSTLGYAFWQGNCSLSEGTDKVVRASVEAALERGRDGSLADSHRSLWAARHEAGYIDDIALTPEDKRELGQLSEPGRSRTLMRRALNELRVDPGRYPRLCLRRLRYFLLFDVTNPKTRHPLYRAGHVLLSVLSILGMALSDGQTRRRLGPSILTFVLLTAFHAMTIVSARFHAPLEPLMAIWAGTLSTVPWPYPRRLTVSYASGSSGGLPA